ncbi:GNAT family N-acetyltransferase [Streptomyces beijiangensis]|uniref:GNAT family N-acetyltransferase n=1 Tax=Streptomyces beijiangensis TaxID=163361 RepID=A0A939F9U3_9ACTN|nr:GNAT family N-acetyltransferase [Streptomyces beijiangensis]MBO0515065.1 GNAT family N-acetyltransferase [Streptomyces beijiangensis]
MDDLVTERLVLHPMSIAEAERVVLAEPADGDLWAPGYPAPGDVEGAAHFLEHCASTGDPQPFGNYEIRRRSDGLVIGGLGFNRPPDEDGTVPIGYALIPDVRGKGYASEALRGLLQLARDLGIRSVIGDADLDNIASQRVMAAVGMERTGEDERVVYFRVDWPEM